MKKIFLLFFSLLGIAAFALAGCANQASTATGATAQPENASLSPATRLALGTLQLDSAGQEIPATQASELLTLWQAYQALSNSETTAQEELDALLDQIQAAMTTEQMHAIDQMELTSDTLTEALLASMPEPIQPSSDTQATDQNSANAGPGAGRPPDGGMAPDGAGGMAPDGAGGMADAGTGILTTADATGQETALDNNITPMLLNALIRMLETKVQAVSSGL